VQRREAGTGRFQKGNSLKKWRNGRDWKNHSFSFNKSILSAQKAGRLKEWMIIDGHGFMTNCSSYTCFLNRKLHETLYPKAGTIWKLD
jgi:hypothetical protein